MCRIKLTTFLLLCAFLLLPFVSKADDNGNGPNLESFTSDTPDGTYGSGSVINIIATFDTDLDASQNPELDVNLDDGASVQLTQVSGDTLEGQYTVQQSDASSHLTVDSITYVNGIQDLSGNQGTNYSVSNSNLGNKVIYTNPNGCTDPYASNYSPSASIDDGSCTYLPPVVSAATFADSVIVTFNQPLVTTNVPSASDFTFKANSTITPILSVNFVDGDDQTIEIKVATSSISHTATLTLSYTSGASPLQSSHASVSSFTDMSVVNNKLSPTLVYKSIQGNTITLEYSGALDGSSIPATSDYTVHVNGNVATVSQVSISGKYVYLTLPITTRFSDIVTLSYAPGTTPVQDSLGDQSASITNQNVTNGIIVGAAPRFSVIVGKKIYLNTANSVKVLNADTGSVIATIPIPGPTFYSSAVNNKIYAIGTSDVYVIDATTDSLIKTIPIGSGAIFSSVVGENVYVSNTGSNTVSVIDSTSDTVIATIPVGTNPVVSNPVGRKIYVDNNGSGNVSVIDTTTNTVVNTISVGAAPYGSSVVGNKLYVDNGPAGSVSVIDTDTGTVLATLNVGSAPIYSQVIGKKVYVNNIISNNVSVIDTDTDTFTQIPIGVTSHFSSVLGKNVYIDNEDSNMTTIIDSDSDSVLAVIPTGFGPYASFGYGDKVYVGNRGENTLSVLDISLIDSPYLNSFTSTSADGAYTSGQSINITANFTQPIQAGSTMTVTLNSGATVILNQVNGTTLSGTYLIGSNDTTPDLAVSSIVSASVSDLNGHTRTNYALDPLPQSHDNLVAESSLITRNIGDSKNITIGSYRVIPTGMNPYQVSPGVTVNGNTFMYVANQGDNTVSVFQVGSTGSSSLVKTLAVGSEPYGLTVDTIGGNPYIYVANTGSNTVSVINAVINLVVATIPVGFNPYYVEHVGTNVYVTNGLSNTVSVIDANTNTVTATIPVGTYPRGIKAHGTDLYVANFGDPNYGGGNYISVINTLNNTVSADIIFPPGSDGPRGVTVKGNYVYVADYRSDNISVIDTINNTVVATIPVGKGPRGMSAVGNYVYVENFDDGTISVIDTSNNTVVKTIIAGHSPAGMGVVGTDIYFSRFEDNELSILDTTTNTLKPATIVSTAPAESVPVFSHTGGFSGGSSGGSGLIFTTTSTAGATSTLVATLQSEIALLIARIAALTASTNNLSSCPDMKLGTTNSCVSLLQSYLNAHGFTVSTTGAGSAGHETTYFGNATQAALITFQKAKGITPSAGYFGSITKAYVAAH